MPQNVVTGTSIGPCDNTFYRQQNLLITMSDAIISYTGVFSCRQQKYPHENTLEHLLVFYISKWWHSTETLVGEKLIFKLRKGKYCRYYLQ